MCAVIKLMGKIKLWDDSIDKKVENGIPSDNFEGFTKNGIDLFQFPKVSSPCTYQDNPTNIFVNHGSVFEILNYIRLHFSYL